jgi:hypothetical protein
MEAHPALSAWESFYVIVGSSGAALTGLQFVVITLVADSRSRTSGQSIAAFGTPTIMHFCAVLFVSGIVSAPWPTMLGISIALGACGIWGIAYVAVVTRRARRQTDYKPVLEDWVWHVILPLAAYVACLVAALVLAADTTIALFILAASIMLLLFIGIHNAWDTVLYVAVDRLQQKTETPRADG